MTSSNADTTTAILSEKTIPNSNPAPKETEIMQSSRLSRR